MKNILFISENINERISKQIISLSKTKKFNLYLATTCNQDLHIKKIRKYVNEIYFYDDSKKKLIKKLQKYGFFGTSTFDFELKNLNKILKTRIFDLVHIHAPPNRPFGQIIGSIQCPYIIDMYDPTYFYGPSRFYSKQELDSERALLENSSAILTKFPNDLYLKYQEEGFDIIKKPRLIFPDYCSSENIINKIHVKKSQTSLAYCGGSDFPLIPKKFAGNNIFIEMCRKLLQNNIKISLISNSFDNKIINNILNAQYYYISRNNNNLNLYPYISSPNLQEFLSGFDFGLQIHDFSKTGHNKIFGETSFGNKFFTYLESGIPIISNSELKWNSFWINEFNVGISVPFKNLKELPSHISNFDLEKAVKNIRALARNELNMDFNINKLVNFYNNIL